MEGAVSECLASHQIRDLVNSSRLIVPSVGSSFESRVQPSSYDPIIGDEAYIIDTDISLFHPNNRETVYRRLLQLPLRQRRRVKLSGGFEFKRGYTYMVPLEERVRGLAKEGECMRILSSPKSSRGRLFVDTRLLADYAPGFDEVKCNPLLNQEIMLWLLIQPLAFNIIAHPGLAFNQLRFLSGYMPKLSPLELLDETKKNPILHRREKDGQLVPVENIVSDGLEVHLGLLGEETAGIVGLRARNNPEPIDMAKKGAYNAEDFFEPIKAEDSHGHKTIIIKRGNYYLLATQEVLRMPAHLNAELRMYSHHGFKGPLHFAGFIDNGFIGDIVLEVRPDEQSDKELEDGAPVSMFDVFKTQLPDKLYGVKIGSSYQGQVGVKVSNNFNAFDFARAAKEYRKLDRIVLVQEREMLAHDTGVMKKLARGENCDKHSRFDYVTAEQAQELHKCIAEGFFHSRYYCEDDNSILQIIPYVLVFGPNGTLFSYVRAKDIKDYGEAKLFGKHSIGLGGHIIQADGPEYVQACLERELREEVKIKGNFFPPKLVGTLVAYDQPVDTVHFGLVFAGYAEKEVSPSENSIKSGGMVLIESILQDPLYSEKYETWSKMLIPCLPEILRRYGDIVRGVISNT